MSKLASGIRRQIERECDDAEHPSGMSTHSGRTRIPSSQVRYLLAVIDALEKENAELKAKQSGS